MLPTVPFTISAILLAGSFEEYLPLYIIVGVVCAAALYALIFKALPRDYYGDNPKLSSDMHNRGGTSWFRQKLSAWEENQMRSNFRFYAKLSERKRKIFGHRVVQFIHEKNFEGRHDLEITPEMRLFIAAVAVRMTLGLRVYRFPSFHTFLIYPEQFYSRVSGAKVRGETHGLGVIAFSWKDYLFGMAYDNDYLNLGYHEFAHALFIEVFRNTIDAKFADGYDAWRELIHREGKLKEAALKKTFRAYANVNEHEFFAVSVENFFERPERFREDLPELYRLMSKMLSQDPLQPSMSYNRNDY